jgi:hypothetical protein
MRHGFTVGNGERAGHVEAGFSLQQSEFLPFTLHLFPEL